MGKFILSVLVLSVFSSVSLAAGPYCDERVEFKYNDLVFKKSSQVESGYLVYATTTSGQKWLPAYEDFIAKQNGFRLRGIVQEGKRYTACGEINSDGMSISKIGEN